jgi:hypothetical protein
MRKDEEISFARSLFAISEKMFNEAEKWGINKLSSCCCCCYHCQNKFSFHQCNGEVSGGSKMIEQREFAGEKVIPNTRPFILNGKSMEKFVQGGQKRREERERHKS